MLPPDVSPRTIIDFWDEAGPSRWYKKDPAFDAEIADRFLTTHEQAASSALNAWEDSPDGALALLLLLDQFPRNMFRDSARAFATDAQALDIAHRALRQRFDKTLTMPLRQFFYMPLMHAEDLRVQEECVKLCEAYASPDNVRFAILHRDIIARFGRFPHRNAVLGRETTPEEQAYLDGGGFKG